MLAAAGLLAQLLVQSQASAQVPVRPLDLEARLSRPFNNITGLRELRDGRVLIVDANDELVLLADFTTGRISQIGRKGSGPGEYRFPYRLFQLGADSVGIEDGGNKRILVIQGSGKLGGMLSSIGTRLGNPVRGEAPRASDTLGRFYADVGFSISTKYDSIPRSAAIVRWKVGTTTRDTVGYVPLLPAEYLVLRPGEGSWAFVASPEFAVGMDGRIAIVRVNPFSVELTDPKGARVMGKPIPYQRVRVSDELKREWREEQKRPVPYTVMTPKGDISAGLGPMGVQEPVRWPAYLPPFLNHASRFAPDGKLWIRLAVAPGQPQIFDIVDQRGVLVERVSAPPRTRLVGFGRSSIYLVRLEEDDQEILERHRFR